MSDERPPPGVRPPPAPPGALTRTPNAEKYVLEADALRRRQLRSALLHGTRRTWREHRATWPAVIAGVVLVGVILAGMAVYGAWQRQNDINREREREQERSRVTTPPPSATTPTPTDGSSERPRERRPRNRPTSPATPAD